MSSSQSKARNLIKVPHPPSKGKSSIGCYPAPTDHIPPPDFGPNCVPAAVARQVDAHFAERRKSKKAKKIVIENGAPEVDSVEDTAAAIAEKYSLCLPQNPARFSAMSIGDHSLPSQSVLQNPQRIVADGPFAVNEAVKPTVVGLNFDGLKPLRLNVYVSNPDVKKTLRDLQLLVQASVRSRNLKDEASAYFNIGLLYEGEGHLRKANDFYLKYLQALGADADPLVFNRIAVNYQLLRMYDMAIEWNMRHLSFSRSMFETIAANCNIALIYRELGDNNKSVEFYKSALETATEMDETEDSPFFHQIESIRSALQDQLELANSESKMRELGTSQLSQYSFGDRLERSDLNRRIIDAQEEYFESEARISREHGDLSKAYGALIANGKLCCVYGDFEKSEEYYRGALEVAMQIGSTELCNHAKVAIGIVRGNQQLKKAGAFDSTGTLDLSLFEGPFA